MADSDIKKDDAGEQTERVLPEAELTNPVVPEAVEEDKTQEYVIGGFEEVGNETINVPSVEKFRDGEIVEITDPDILATGDNDGQWRVAGYERDARGIPVPSEDPGESDPQKKKKLVVNLEEVMGSRMTKVFETDIKAVGEGTPLEGVVSLPEKMEGREVILKGQLWTLPWRIKKVIGEAEIKPGEDVGVGILVVLYNDESGLELKPISLAKLAELTDHVLPERE